MSRTSVVTFRGMAWFRLCRDGYEPFDPSSPASGPRILMHDLRVLQIASRLP